MHGNLDLDIDTLQKLLDMGKLDKSEFDELTNNSNSSTVNNVISQFNDYLREEYSTSTADGYRSNVVKWLEYELGIDDIKSLDDKVKMPVFSFASIEQFLHGLSDDGNYSSASIRRFKNSILAFLEFYADRFKVNVPSVKKIKIPTESNQTEPIVLHDSEIRAIADSCPESKDARVLGEDTFRIRNKAMIMFMYEAGMRRHELIDCKYDHINIDKLMVDIYNGNEKDRVGYFTADTASLLTKYIELMERDVKAINREGNRRVDMGEYLFQTTRSPQISYSTIFRAIKEASFEYYLKVARKSGITSEADCKAFAEEKSYRINTETLRHSRRAFLFSQGYDVDRVQCLMGDENKHATKRYLKLAQQLYPERFVN